MNQPLLTPPSDDHAEHDLLCGCLFDEQTRAKAIESLTPPDFTAGQHRVLFEVLVRLGVGADIVEIRNALNSVNGTKMRPTYRLGYGAFKRS